MMEFLWLFNTELTGTNPTDGVKQTNTVPDSNVSGLFGQIFFKKEKTCNMLAQTWCHSYAWTY